MSLRIPLSLPDITEAEIEAVTAVLRTNCLSLGPKLEEFEEAMSAFHEMPQAIAVSSGTAGLHLAIRALKIGEGDEVILPSFTFIAVANAVRYERATPVFVDIDPITLNMNPACVEAAMTTRTKAMIVVHTFGVPAQMDALMQIAHRHNLVVIEDACEAIGANYNNQRVGSFGDISVFAFYPNKQITTGEGGAVLVRDPRLASRIRALRNQGRYPSNDWLQHTEIGYNYRLSEMACALGLVQLTRLPAIVQHRAAVARSYNELLTQIDGILRPPLSLPSRSISWFVYVVRLAERFTIEDRDKVLESLLRQGIGCARYFAPIHLQPAYSEVPSAQQATLPVTEAVAQRTLALPFFNRLSIADQTEVAHALNSAIRTIADGS
jgi:dTDP-4-amino-4,6-dideoxygalactose transaminase